ncbi:DUF664 domain-containing protein [Streptosporangium sp. NPDC006007]|uniref:mycothiol transferase n=1 Tax=Streptosporangium sp. NPDC006007 TaxID=3154575 RepID=UPI0033BD8EB4
MRPRPPGAHRRHHPRRPGPPGEIPHRARPLQSRLTKARNRTPAPTATDQVTTIMDPRRKVEMSLCQVYSVMVQEYARHNSHADLLRERIDGTTGR